MAARVLHAQFDRRPTIEDTLQAVMVECRRRSRLSAGQFARAVNARSPRCPGLMDASIDAFEAGRAIPGADVLLRAMELAGHDVMAALSDWVEGTSAKRYPLPSSASRGASSPR